MYKLNYAPTTLGVQNWRENICEGTRTKNVERHWYKGLCFWQIALNRTVYKYACACFLFMRSFPLKFQTNLLQEDMCIWKDDRWMQYAESRCWNRYRSAGKRSAVQTSQYLPAKWRQTATQLRQLGGRVVLPPAAKLTPLTCKSHCAHNVCSFHTVQDSFPADQRGEVDFSCSPLDQRLWTLRPHLLVSKRNNMHPFTATT